MTRKGLLAGFIITQDTILNFMELSQNNGVVHLSLENQGNSTLIIDDFSKEEIASGQTFIIESPVAVCNTAFPLKFKPNATPSINRVICRYIVEKECFTK